MTNVVRARLIADATVLATVGQRVYILHLQQDSTTPAIVTTPLQEEPQYTLDGEETIRNEIWQIDCYSSSYTEVETLADDVESAMAPAGSDFEAIRIDREVLFEDRTELYRISLDYSLWIQ